MVRVLVLSSKEISSVGASLRAANRSFTLFSLFSLLAAVYLVVALSVPGAFLIAKQASVDFSSQFILLSEHSFDQFGGNSGKHGGEDSWPGPKRLRGALLSKDSIEKIISSLIVTPLPGGPRIVLEHAQRNLVLAEELQLPKDGAFPQELLGRSPPSSPH
jgi:hypothetical protein